jgi:NAD(P)-dependent dehydrogenase (short-subunit alcohol dehydrogenase family)
VTSTPTQGARFRERAVLITGAASGIGRAVAERLAGEGAHVALADRDEAGAEKAAAAMGAAGGRAFALRCDVSDPDAAHAAVKEAVDRLGALHVLCNAAGVGSFHRFAELSLAEWRRIFAVNLDGVFHMSQAALPHLLAARGNIVNLASLAGLRGQAYSAAYCASKAGVVSLTRSLAVEFAKQGLRVNCICPAGVATPLLGAFKFPEDADPELLARLTLVQRLATPAQVAAAVAWLASDEAAPVNGVALPFDFGTSAG